MLKPSRKLLVAASAAVAIGASGGLGAALLIASSDDSAAKAAAEVASLNQRLEDVIARAQGADDLAALRASAAEAQTALADVDGQLRAAAAISDATLRAAAEQALAAGRAAFELIAQLDGFEPENVAGWEGRLGSVGPAVERLEGAQRVLAHLDYDGPTTLPVDALARGHQQAREVLGAADRRLRAWRRRHAAARRDRAADLAVLDGYAGGAERYVANYSAQRSELSTWMSKVDSEGVTFDEAYEFLGDAISARAAVRTGLANLDPPASVSAAHNDLVAVLARAVDAVDGAYSGTVDYEFGNYDYYRDAPGWSEFKARSDEIGAAYSSALGEWRKRLDQARRRIEKRVLPQPPAV